MMRRILICGDRNWTDAAKIERLVGELPCRTLIIEGDARGADRMAGEAALKFGHALEVYPADWNRHGKRAGPIRNAQMLKEGKPDEVWAFHDNIEASKGTKHMMTIAYNANIPVRLFRASDTGAQP